MNQSQKTKTITLTDAINKILQYTMICKSEEVVAQKALAVAEDLTTGKFGFVNEINEYGTVDNITITNPGWDAYMIKNLVVIRMLKGLILRGLWVSPHNKQKPIITNSPLAYPSSVGNSDGHPLLTSFHTIFQKQDEMTIDAILLANKQSWSNIDLR